MNSVEMCKNTKSKTSNEKNKQTRYSSLSEFEKERDILMKEVYPDLRRYCRDNYGVDFQVRLFNKQFIIDWLIVLMFYAAAMFDHKLRNNMFNILYTLVIFCSLWIYDGDQEKWMTCFNRHFSRNFNVVKKSPWAQIFL